MSTSLKITFNESTKKKIEHIADFLEILQDRMDESERKQLSRVLGFSFSDIASDLKTVEGELLVLNEKAETPENNELNIVYEVRDSNLVGGEILPSAVITPFAVIADEITTPILSGQKGNALNILLHLDEIYTDELKSYMDKWGTAITGLLGNMWSSCRTPDATTQVIQGLFDKLDPDTPGTDLIKEGLMNWDKFIDEYIKYPRPIVEKFNNPLDTKEMREKTTLSFLEYMHQQDLFGLVKHGHEASETWKQINKQYERNKTYYMTTSLTDDFVATSERWASQAASYAVDEVEKRTRNLMLFLRQKVCPQKLLIKVVQCSLGVQECNEFVKILGAPNLVFILRSVQSIDPRVRMLVDGFNALPETERTEEKFLDLVSDTYKEEQDKLCRIILIAIQYFLDFPAPNYSLPRLTTVNRFGNFYEQLGKIVLNLLLSTIETIIINMVEEILECSTYQDGASLDSFIETIATSAAETSTQNIIGLANALINQANSLSDIGGKEEKNFTTAIENMRGLTNDAYDNLSESEKIKLEELQKLQQAISEEGFYDELVAKVGMMQVLKLYSGKALPKTYTTLKEDVFTDIDVSTADIQHTFASIGQRNGLDSLENDVLSSLEELRDAQQPTQESARQPLSDERKDRIREIISKIIGLSESTESSLLASAMDQAGVPQAVQDAIRNSVDSNLSPIRMAYDSDIELYRVATSEEKIAKRKVKKVYFKGETITQPYQEEYQDDEGVTRQRVATRQIEVDKTIINPEFESMVNQGHVPIRTTSDGKPIKGALLGTKMGGYTKEHGTGAVFRFRKDDDKIGINLENKVGPYTDYGTGTFQTTINSPNAFALKEERQVVFASGMRDALGLVPETTQIGEKKSLPNFEQKIFNDYYKGRGDDVVLSEEELRLLEKYNTEIPKLKEQIDATNEASDTNPTAQMIKSYAEDLLSQWESERESILQSNGILDNFENYTGKSFYGFQGKVAKNVITESEIIKNFSQEPDGGVSSPQFRVSVASEFGTKLDNKTFLYLYREGTDPISHTYTYSKNLDINLVRKYAPIYDENECDVPGQNLYKTNLYTPQENVFHQITREYLSKFYDPAGEVMESAYPNTSGQIIFSIPSGVVRDVVSQSTVDALLKEEGNDFDDIYRNIFLIFFNKMRNSALLQELDVASIALPGYEPDQSTYNGEPPIALSFINLNPTNSKNYKLLRKDPRIFNFNGISNLVLENYALFEAEGVGEENPDGNANYNTNFMLAQKSVHPVMVARIYLLEHYLQSLVPALEINASLTQEVKKQILNTVQTDMAKNYLYTKKFAENTLSTYNLMMSLGKVPPQPGPVTFAKAFDFFLENEYKNVIANIRKIVLKIRPECDDFNPFSGDDQAGNNEQANQEEQNRLKNMFLDSLPMYAFPVDRISAVNKRKTVRIPKQSFSISGQVRSRERFLLDDAEPEGVYSREVNPEYQDSIALVGDIDEGPGLELVGDESDETEFTGTGYSGGSQTLGGIPNEDQFLDIVGQYVSELESSVLTSVEVDEFSQGKLILQYSITPQIARTNITENDLANFKAKVRLLYVRKQQIPTGPSNITSERLRDSIQNESFNPFNVQKNDLSSGEFVNFATGMLLNMDGDEYQIPEEPVLETNEYLVRQDEILGETIRTYDEPRWQADHDEWESQVESVNNLREAFDEFADSTFYRCYPLASAEGTIRELTGTSAQTIFEECKRKQGITENSADFVAIENFIEEVQRQTYNPLMKKLRDSEMFDIMFGYCFDINTISTVAAMKVTQSNANAQLKRMFTDTKNEIRKYLTNIVDIGTDFNKDNLDCVSDIPADESFNFGNFNLNAEFSSTLLKFLITTPLYIYKGWTKVADPHVLIASTIVDMFETGFVIPKLKEVNKTIPNTDPPECRTETSLVYPGDPIVIPFFESLVMAPIVTFAPMPFTGFPFMPTPFGLIYYAAVSPLLDLLEMTWKNDMIFQNPEITSQMNAASGLDFGDIPVCIGDTIALQNAQAEQEERSAENEEKLDENSCPPALDIEFYEGDDC